MNSLLSALALLVYGSACAGSPAVFRRTLVRAAPSERSVVVLLDREPELPFVVLGELSAVALESPTSIAMMQREAALQGLDGIYWIECARARGSCTAKGFVYSKVPELGGREGQADCTSQPELTQR
jgi:hypothetical protein